MRKKAVVNIEWEYINNKLDNIFNVLTGHSAINIE